MLRPADAEQLKLALSDHQRQCKACREDKPCEMARKLQDALNHGGDR